jgi:hypothetical protein
MMAGCPSLALLRPPGDTVSTFYSQLQAHSLGNSPPSPQHGSPPAWRALVGGQRGPIRRRREEIAAMPVGVDRRERHHRPREISRPASQPASKQASRPASKLPAVQPHPSPTPRTCGPAPARRPRAAAPAGGARPPRWLSRPQSGRGRSPAWRCFAAPRAPLQTTGEEFPMPGLCGSMGVGTAAAGQLACSSGARVKACKDLIGSLSQPEPPGAANGWPLDPYNTDNPAGALSCMGMQFGPHQTPLGPSQPERSGPAIRCHSGPHDARLASLS